MKNLNEDDGIEVLKEAQYINGVEVSVTPLEIIMDLRLTDAKAQQTVAYVMMAPEFAKGMLAILTAAVEKFEKDHGPIRDVSKIFNRRAATVSSSFRSSGGVQ